MTTQNVAPGAVEPPGAAPLPRLPLGAPGPLARARWLLGHGELSDRERHLLSGIACGAGRPSPRDAVLLGRLHVREACR